MKIIILNIMLLICSFTSYAQLNIAPPYSLDQLIFVGKNDTTDIYIVKNSQSAYSNEKNLRQVIMLFNELVPIYVEEDKIFINSQANLYIVNCQEPKYLLQESYLYDNNFGNGNLIYTAQTDEWQTLEEDSLLSSTKELICDKALPAQNQK